MGTLAAIGESEDFGTSPFFGQLLRQANCLPVYHNNGYAGDKGQ
jgi:hypothetical protein